MKRPSTFKLLAMSALVSFMLCACDETEPMSEPQNESLISFSQQSHGFTKGSILDSTNLSECLVYAHYYTTDHAPTFEANFMNEVKVTKDPSGKWTYSPTRYWPVNGKIEFIGYAPIANANNGLTNKGIEPAYGLSIDYKIPQDVTKQPDLVLAKTTGISRVIVPLQFQRLLSKISFSMKGTATKKIESITITNLCDIANFHSKDSEWYFPSSMPKDSFTVSIPSGTLADITGTTTAQPITTDSGHLFMLPQTLASGVEIKVEVLNTTTNTTKTQIKKFPADHVWEMGKSYNYLIDLSTTYVTFEELYGFLKDGGDAKQERLPEGDTWVITGDYNLPEGCNLGHNLRLEIIDAVAAGREVNLVFQDETDFDFLGSFDNSKLSSVSAPHVTEIPYNTFFNCPNLKFIDFPSVTVVEETAFQSCPNLVDVNLPLVDSIGTGSFQSCPALTTLNLPKVKHIGSTSFAECTSLKDVNMPLLEDVPAATFGGCTQLPTITLASAKSVGAEAFSGCAALKTVNFPEATEVGNNAFNGCSTLETVELPKLLTMTGIPFSGCTALKEVDMRSLLEVSNDAFSGAQNLETINIASATTIGERAFQNCVKLTTVDLSEVTEVKVNAFNGCSTLATIDLPKATSIGISAFQNCKALTTINFPEVIAIGSDAFNTCSSLASIKLPKVTKIATYAFAHCNVLQTLWLATDPGVKLVEVANMFVWGYFDIDLTIGTENHSFVVNGNELKVGKNGQNNRFHSITEVTN